MKYFDNLKNKPETTRRVTAVVCSTLATLSIAVVWAFGFGPSFAGDNRVYVSDSAPLDVRDESPFDTISKDVNSFVAGAKASIDELGFALEGAKLPGEETASSTDSTEEIIEEIYVGE